MPMFDFFKTYWKKERTIHLDYAATTPVHPEVLKAMAPYWNELWANPNAIYTSGVKARNAIEAARADVARVLRVRAHDITFTSGGTEANNLAIAGIIEAAVGRGRAYGDIEIVSTLIEHPSVLETLKWYERKGVVIHYIPVSEEGCIDEKAFTTALNEKTVLSTFAYANSEVGVVQRVKQLTRIVKKFNQANDAHVLVHLDASQAPLWLSCEMDMLGVDLMTLDAGKCYGPKGVGVLARRHGVALVPQMRGGDQEGGLRAGTENAALIIGCAHAITRAQKNWREQSAQVTKLRDFFINELERTIPNIIVNGSRIERIANNINISIPGIDTEFAVIVLDRHGIACSTKSACGGAKGNGSTVVRAMTHDDARARSTIRFTLGENSTKHEILTTVRILSDHVTQMRAFHATFKTL